MFGSPKPTFRASIIAEVIEAQRECSFCISTRSQLLASPTGAAIHRTYKASDAKGLRWLGGGVPRLVVPAEPCTLREKLLRESQDSAYEAHLGQFTPATAHAISVDKTYARLAAFCYWPRMLENVREFVATSHAPLAQDAPSSRLQTPVKREVFVTPLKKGMSAVWRRQKSRAAFERSGDADAMGGGAPAEEVGAKEPRSVVVLVQA